MAAPVFVAAARHAFRSTTFISLESRSTLRSASSYAALDRGHGDANLAGERLRLQLRSHPPETKLETAKRAASTLSTVGIYAAPANAPRFEESLDIIAIFDDDSVCATQGEKARAILICSI
jgi:hypothetical protein